MLASFCLMTWLLLQSAPAPLSLTQEEAVTLALERSPRLLSARAEALSAQARLDGASLLAQTNPELQGAVGPRLRDGVSSLDVTVGVSQRLELFGQRGARREAAAAQLTASEARLETLRVSLAAEVRGAFARLLASEQEWSLADEGQLLAEQALQAAEERQTAGAASRIEVNTARVELGRAAHARVLAERRRTLARGELRLLLGLEPSEAMEAKGELRPGMTDPPPLDALVERALARRADVKAARSELDAARAEVELASREAWPGTRLGASYSQEEGARIVQGTLGIELPVFNRNQAARGVGAARLTQTRGLLEATERLVRTEVGLALERYRTARAAVAVYSEDVLEALQQNLALVNEAYRAGKVDFFQLLLIRRDALDARRGYIEALEELLIAEAQLTRTLGEGQP
ncbi:TolC family protein [Melittangium boletus]|uniref:Outer membrane efflux protein n=1 Tax=Melittangium boletus DSM 14713 TaxID=1294270 RepID=A0A250I7Z3_9BACT|nr:TolC family protein [Melittangium boletus]ATB27291.1 outer membrane efflux protein [Melittangium boletus DSM 14713]